MIINNNISEAETISDWEDLIIYETIIEQREDIKEDREMRLNALKGKYIIVSNGKKGLIYLQDKRISKDHYWTKFLSNAISFNNKESAQFEVLKLKYNKPRIALVDSKFNLLYC